MTTLDILPYIPLELIFEILFRLPVQSLLRFRCICRDWLSVIDSKNFVNMHLTESKNNRRRCLITQRFRSCLHFVDLKSFMQNMELRIPPLWCHTSSTLWGSCNGLMCMSSNSWIDMALWNPSTKKHFILPSSGLEDVELWPKYDPLWDVGIGFGFNSSTDDYKVVIIIPCCRNERLVKTKVKVFSLRSSLWRRVYGFPKGFRAGNMQGVLFRESIYWHLVHKSNCCSSMVVLDLVTDEFRVLQLPSSLRGRYYWEIKIQATEEYFWISSFRDNKGFELWKMDECGEGSWTELISIHDPNIIPYTHLMCPVQYIKDERMLFLARSSYDSPTEVVWYVFETKTFEKVKICNWTSVFCPGNIFFSESLVSLDAGGNYEHSEKIIAL